MLQIINMILAVLADSDPVAEASLIAIAVIVVAYLALALLHGVIRKMRGIPTHVLWETRQHFASAVPCIMVQQTESRD
jgi:hypothetical protein